MGNFLYESIRLDNGWSEPALIVRPDESGPPVVVIDDANDLQIAWNDASAGVQHATQPFYMCDESTGSYLGDAILAVATSGLYRPADEAVPFCQNEFLNFLHLPVSNPAFTDDEPTKHGGFDDVAD